MKLLVLTVNVKIWRSNLVNLIARNASTSGNTTTLEKTFNEPQQRKKLPVLPKEYLPEN